MKRRFIILVTGFLFFLTPAWIIAQSKTKGKNKTGKTVASSQTSQTEQKKDSAVVKNTLKLLVHINENSVKLRWALENPVGWKACNEYGFRIERYTLKVDTAWQNSPVQLVLADPYKARPLSEWEGLAKSDDYAAILAQAIYGKDMQIEVNDKNPLTQIVSETQDLQQRYTLSMLACDMSFEAAKMGGWGYEDNTVKKNERYFYRIIPLVPLTKARIDSAFTVVRMDDYQPLPAPGKPEVIFSDSMATLGYNYFLLRETYIAFHVERSTDGKNFEQITKVPVTAMNVKKGQESYQFYFSDKLKDNKTEYHYRIKGVTSFSDVGPASPSIKGKGISRTSVFPHLTSAILNEKDQAELEWEFDALNESKIKAFEIGQSKSNEGPFKTVQTLQDVKARKTVIKKLEQTNYFTVTAVGLNGERNTSSRRFLQLIDSIPPAPPEIMSAVIDSLGKVRLEWKANTEKDVLGYKVLRANNQTEEPAFLTDTIYYNTIIEDQLNASMINRKIYYYVIALDKRYNESKFSKAAEVTRPDVTPPTSPLFKTYEIKDNGIYLKWARCQDNDLARHLLIRKEAVKNAQWLTLAEFRDTTSFFLDKTAEPGRTYYYSIVARDQSGLESLPVKSLKLTVPPDPKLLKVLSFKAVPDAEGSQVTLQWITDRTDIAQFELYKGFGKEPVTLWKVVDGKMRSINDEWRSDLSYEYKIRIITRNGSSGHFTTVKF